MYDKSYISSHRPTPLQEYYICRVSEKYGYNNFTLTGRFNKPVDDVLLSHGLRLMIERNPIFTLNFFRESRKYWHRRSFYYRPVSKIAYKDIVSHWERDSYGPQLMEELADIELPVDVDRPTWRLIKIGFKNDEPPALIFVTNHILFDGNAASNVFDELIACFNELEGSLVNSVCEDLFGPKDHKTAASVVVNHDLALYKVPLRFLIRTLIEEIIFSPLKRCIALLGFGNPFAAPASFLKFNPVPSRRFNKSKFRLIKFSPTETRAVLQRCKKLDLTMTPFIGACAYQSAQLSLTPYVNLIQGYPFNKPRQYSIPMAMCGRRFEPGLKKELRFGLCVGQVVPLVRTRSRSLWAVGDILKTELDQSQITKMPFHMTGMLRYVNVWSWLKNKAENPDSREGIEVSNIGLKNFARGSWEVTDLIFSQGVSFPHVALSVTSTPKGGLNIVVGSVDTMDSWRVDGSKVMDSFVRKLEGILWNNSGVKPVEEAELSKEVSVAPDVVASKLEEVSDLEGASDFEDEEDGFEVIDREEGLSVVERVLKLAIIHQLDMEVNYMMRWGRSRQPSFPERTKLFRPPPDLSQIE